MPEKAVYHLTENGEKEFERLMFEVSKEPIYMFLDFNAVIVNLNGLPIEQRTECLEIIKSNVAELKMTIEKNRAEKNTNVEIPDYAKAVLNQQYLLVFFGHIAVFYCYALNKPFFFKTYNLFVNRRGTDFYPL
mgnify:CR=1 FL=1